MKPKSGPIVIVFCGPESTAKSTVSKQMASHYGAKWVPEHARSYIEELARPYSYDDVVTIMQKQIVEYQRLLKSKHEIVIFDTFLIITKVWFEFVYQKVPDELMNLLNKIHIDLYLLCEPDIPWVSDGVRENEALRQELYDIYKKEIEKYQFPYQTISGEGKSRLMDAQKYIDQILTKQTNYDHQPFTSR